MAFPFFIWRGKRGRMVEGDPDVLAGESWCSFAKWANELDRESGKPSWAVVLRNASVLGNARLVLSEDKRAVSTVQALHGIQDPMTDRAFRRLRLLKRKALKGKSLLLGSASSHNHYHWMFDTLTRLHILERVGIQMPSVDRIMLDGNTSRNIVEETFRLLGLPMEKVEFLEKGFAYSCEELVLPSMSTIYPGITTRWTAQWLREVFLGNEKAVNGSQTERILVVRGASSSRQLDNLGEIQRALEPFGFQTKYLENTTLKQQVELFSSASCVVAQHGAGLANATFCRPGTTLIELMAPGHINDCYERLAGHCDLNYFRIIGKASTNPVNCTVSPEQILSLLPVLQGVTQTSSEL